MKEIKISDILTESEITRVCLLYNQIGSSGKFARTVCKEIIEPNLARINKSLGQENVPMYLAYAIEYALSQGVK